MNEQLSQADSPRPPLLHRVASGHLQSIDYTIAFVLLLVTLPHLTAFRNGNRVSAGGVFLVLTFGGALPIAIRRRAPILALAISTIAISIATAIGQSFTPDPLVAIPLYQVASVRERRESIPALGIVSIALIVAAAISAATNAQGGEASFSVLLAIAAWFVGDSARVRRAYTAGLAEQAAQRSREALERAQRGVAEERLRIARELHDVVAHSLSVIAVQSGVGRHVIDEQPEEAKKALAAVETTSRGALDELRRMLGVLRREGPNSADLTPAPGIENLPAMVDQVRAGGFPVELNINAEATRGLSPSIELSVYRIVQEALTNVVKHAGPAAANVDIYSDGVALIIEVTDNGRGSTARDTADGGSNGEHHGIVGMRERVALFNGSFTAEHRPDGGFRVFARLPLESQIF